MADLAADIARIAALRGRSADHYVQAERMRRSVPFKDVLPVFMEAGRVWPADDMAAFDQLPPASRRAIASLPNVVCATIYRDLLDRIQDERALILALLDVAPHAMRTLALKQYGSEHPQASRGG